MFFLSEHCWEAVTVTASLMQSRVSVFVFGLVLGLCKILPVVDS